MAEGYLLLSATKENRIPIFAVWRGRKQWHWTHDPSALAYLFSDADWDRLVPSVFPSLRKAEEYRARMQAQAAREGIIGNARMVLMRSLWASARIVSIEDCLIQGRFNPAIFDTKEHSHA